MNVIALMPPLSLIKLLCSSVPNYTNNFFINTNFMIGNLFVVLYLLCRQPYHPAAQDRLPTEAKQSWAGQYLDGRPPGKN